MKIQMNKVKCVADRSYNKADDMHLMASIKSRLDTSAAAHCTEKVGW